MIDHWAIAYIIFTIDKAIKSTGIESWPMARGISIFAANKWWSPMIDSIHKHRLRRYIFRIDVIINALFA